MNHRCGEKDAADGHTGDVGLDVATGSPARAPIDVRLSGIVKSFGGVHALRGVDVSLQGGLVHALVGPNGAGKSTLIKVLSGALSPDVGEILIDGHAVHLRSPAQAQELGIAVVHQQTPVFPQMSVADNVGVSHFTRRWLGPVPIRNRRHGRRIAAQALERVGVSLDLGMHVERLTAAERKFVAIARALTTEARVLVLDEPTTALDPSDVKEVLALVRRLADRGLAVVFVSHKLDEVLGISDEISALRDGSVIEHACRDQIDLGRLVRLVAGEELEEVRVASTATERVRVECRGVTGAGLSPTDLDVHEGEIVGLTGLEGSGAGVFARLLAAARPRDAGEIIVDGRRLRRGDRTHARRMGIGYVPPDRQYESVMQDLTIEQTIAVGALERVSRFGLVSRRKMRALAREYIDALQIRPAVPTMRVGQLSGGNQQKVVLARTLASGTSILMAEEPTHGVDIGAKAEIHNLLRRFVGDGGTLLVSSAEVEEVVGLADRVAVFRHGSLAGVIPADAGDQAVMELAVGVEGAR